jgi:hypothetical protein
VAYPAETIRYRQRGPTQPRSRRENDIPFHGFREQPVKPIAMGRRNRLFTGGWTAAILFSLASTRKALMIDPFAYLSDVLDRVCTRPARRIEQLLPGRCRAAESGAGNAAG